MKDDAWKRSKSSHKESQHREKEAKKQKNSRNNPKATKKPEAPKTHTNWKKCPEIREAVEAWFENLRNEKE